MSAAIDWVGKQGQTIRNSDSRVICFTSVIGNGVRQLFLGVKKFSLFSVSRNPDGCASCAGLVVSESF